VADRSLSSGVGLPFRGRADGSTVVIDPSSFLPATSVADGDWLGR
jgi:hypothetical protein